MKFWIIILIPLLLCAVLVEGHLNTRVLSDYEDFLCITEAKENYVRRKRSPCAKHLQKEDFNNEKQEGIAPSGILSDDQDRQRSDAKFKKYLKSKIPSAVANRPTSWSPGMDITIESGGRNIVIPASASVNSLLDLPETVPVYRAEADPNRRLGPDENGNLVIGTKMGYFAIGSDFRRTEDFMQQSRARETKAQRAANRELQSSLDRLLFPIDYEDRVAAGQFDLKSNIQQALNKLKTNSFDASGQTIRTSSIPKDLAVDIIAAAVPENINSLLPLDNRQVFGRQGYTQKQKPDVKNVDVTKSHNQFGIGGNTLEKLTDAISASGVKEGTTYNGNRRSEPNIRLPGL